MSKTINGYKLLSDFKFQSNYSRFDNNLERNETWEESVDRVFNDMHKIKFKDIIESNNKFKEYYEFAIKKYKEKKILGSQRALQFGGLPILKHNARMFNCTVSYCDRLDFFQEAMYMLLCGCGVGFSVQHKHIEKLPIIKKRSNKSKVFVIDDSIEGWADAIGVLLSSYFDGLVPFPKYQNCHVNFDYNNIRPKGSYISGGFKAPGHEGLRKSIQKIEELLEKELDKPNCTGKIEPIVAYDIVMHMSDAVLSGGVRRSATICLFSPNDEKMLNAKTGNWFIENPQRARSNNTVLLNKNTLTKEEFDKYFKYTKEFGEPGFGFTNNEDIIFNPCFEIGMYPQTKEGVSGWECCNLVEINGNSCTNEEEFYDNCKAASFVATLQAAYTNFKYLKPESKIICDNEALLGVSITGFMNNPQILLNPEIQKKGAAIVKKINKEVAEMICINQAARTTCVKPSGNASTILGTASGIHGEHFKRYFRNVQVNKEDDIAIHLKKVNPKMFEDSVWSANNTDWVVSFPIEANPNSIFKDELIGIKLLEYVKLTQQNWIEEGTNIELCVDKSIRHNVSNTIIVDDWDEVKNYIFDNKEWFSGISLLPITGDKDYNQAPFTSILTSKEIIKKYGDTAMFASGLIVDGLNAFNNNLWLACDTLNGLGEKIEYTDDEVKKELIKLTPKEAWKNLGFKNGTLDILSKTLVKPEIEEYKRYMDSTLIGTVHNYALKKDWIRRAKQFSERYFDSIKEMTYCLKDVNNYHKWIEIKRELKDVDWEKNKITPSYVDIDTTGAISCNGNSCEITF